MSDENSQPESRATESRATEPQPTEATTEAMTETATETTTETTTEAQPTEVENGVQEQADRPRPKGRSVGAERAAAALKGVVAEPGVAKPDAILIADDVTRSFGGVRAVRVEHLEVQRGTITALIGPNGAGKSTFFNLISGFDQPNSGKWSFDGKDISGSSAFRIARLGMVRTFQLTKALMRLTTLENVMLGAIDQRGERIVAAPFRWLWKSQEGEIEARADVLLERFRLTHMRDEFAGTMSGGQRKLLEMARAMMVDPAMIMLDEPMAGVNPALTQSLLGHIETLRDEGTTIVLVEHDMDVIMSVSDWIVVFAQGEVIAEGRPNDIRSNAKVIEAYLGKSRGLPDLSQQTFGDEAMSQEERS